MIGREFRFHNGKKGAALAIRMELGRKQDRIKRVLRDGTVLVELKGKPDQPKDMLIDFLANELSLNSSDFDIIEGKEGSDILISILDVGPGDIQNKILAIIAN